MRTIKRLKKAINWLDGWFGRLREGEAKRSASLVSAEYVGFVKDETVGTGIWSILNGHLNAYTGECKALTCWNVAGSAGKDRKKKIALYPLSSYERKLLLDNVVQMNIGNYMFIFLYIMHIWTYFFIRNNMRMSVICTDICIAKVSGFFFTGYIHSLEKWIKPLSFLSFAGL